MDPKLPAESLRVEIAASKHEVTGQPAFKLESAQRQAPWLEPTTSIELEFVGHAACFVLNSVKSQLRVAFLFTG